MRRALFLVFALITGAAHAQSTDRYTPASERYSQRFVQPGPELVLMYVTSPDCGPCRTLGMKSAVEKAKVALMRQAAEADKQFYAVGVIPYAGVEEGLAFLDGSGAFDELVVGRGWLNSSALAHTDVITALPTIVVYERTIGMSRKGELQATEPTYLLSIMGDTAIMEWADAGAPLDRSD